jgi:hypothetical protein
MTARRFDPAAIDDGLRAQQFVATHAQLAALGLSTSSITRRIAPRGPWQRLLPGVVLAHRGTPTRRELLLGARAFCGEESVITGLDALRAQGLRTLSSERHVDVLVPVDRQRKSFGYVRVERTRRLPEPLPLDGIPYAPVPRALVDAVRRIENLDAVRDLVASTVQNRLCTVEDLRTQVLGAARARTALARLVLGEVADGVRSVAEAKGKDAMRRYGIPAPLWNVSLCRPDGTLLLTPDCYWPQFGAALEIDSFAWHLAPAAYLRTMQRSRRMVIGGVLLLPFGPVEIIDNPSGFAREVDAFLRLAGRRPQPEGIVVVPRAAA